MEIMRLLWMPALRFVATAGPRGRGSWNRIEGNENLIGCQSYRLKFGIRWT